MKSILRWKYFDLCCQAVGGVAPVAYFASKGNTSLLLICYCILGGCQALSCLLNRLFLNKRYKVFTRYLYEIVVLLIALCTAVAFIWGRYKGADVNGRQILLFYTLLFITPGLAILYIGITVAEIVKIRRG